MDNHELTKILRPGIGRLVERTRLYELLDSQKEIRITWIWAPAGSGKTSLLASYSIKSGLPTIWYRLDEGDRDVSTFFELFSRAISITYPDLFGHLPKFAPDNLTELPAFYASFFAEMARRLPDRLIIVLDDYHTLNPNSPVHQALKYLLTNAPSGWKFLVTSRENPSQDLLFLIVRRDLQLTDWDQIRLDREESLAILKEFSPSERTEEDMEELLAFSDGWIAALMILSQWSSKINPTEKHPARGFDFLFQYIAGEVYNVLNESQKRIFLMLSFFDEFDEDRLKALIGADQASEFIHRMYRQNLFIEEYLANDRIAYRFHRLVRDYLRRVAHDFFESGELLKIQRRIAEIQEEAGEHEDAIRQYLKARCMDDAFRLILKYADYFVESARYATLESLMNKFPVDPYRNDPWFVCYYALSIQPFRPAESRSEFSRAFDLFKERNDVTGMLEAWSRIFATMHYDWNILYSMKSMVEWMRSNLRMLQEANPDLRLAVHTGLLNWTILYDVQAASMREISFSILEEWHYGTNLELQIGSLLQLIIYVGLVHPRHIQFQTLERMIRDVEIISNHPLVVMTLCNIRCVFYIGSGRELDRIYEIASKGMKISEESGMGNWKGVFLGLQIAICIYRMDRMQTLSLLPLMGEIARGGNKPLKIFYYAMRNWAAMTFDIPEYSPLEDIYICLEIGAQLKRPQLIDPHFFQAAMTELRYGSLVRALSFAEKGDQVAKKAGSRPIHYTALLVTARILLEQGDVAEAGRRLSLALKYARRYGYSRTFWWWDLRMMSVLMAFALREKIEISTAIRIIRDLDLEIVDDKNISLEWPMPVEIRTLGDFQIEVGGRVLEVSLKKKQKQIALLQSTIALGPEPVLLEYIADLLWPDHAGDTAMSNLEITIHRLRKWIGRPELLIIRDGKISINRKICRVDVYDFLDFMSQDGCSLGTISRLYRGPFLSSYEQESWTHPMRESLKRRFKYFILDLGLKAEESNDPESAIVFYQTGLKKIPGDEDLAQTLLRLYKEQGRDLEMRQLSEEMGLLKSMRDFRLK